MRSTISSARPGAVAVVLRAPSRIARGLAALALLAFCVPLWWVDNVDEQVASVIGEISLFGAAVLAVVAAWGRPGGSGGAPRRSSRRVRAGRASPRRSETSSVVAPPRPPTTSTMPRQLELARSASRAAGPAPGDHDLSRHVR